MIKMRLDTTSVRALIQDNPEFEVELQKAVMRNITDDLLKVNISKRVDEILNSLATRSGSYYSPTYTLNPGFAAAVQNIVNEQAAIVAEKRLEAIVTAEVAKQCARLRIELQGELKALMRVMLTPEMAAEIMREKLLS